MAVPIEAFYLGFGKRLLDRRIALGLTQEQLGRRLQPTLTRASVANIEAGKQRVLAHTFFALAAALETTMSDLASPPVTTDADIERELAVKIGQRNAANLISRLVASSSTNGAENERNAGTKASGAADRRVRHSRRAR